MEVSRLRMRLLRKPSRAGGAAKKGERSAWLRNMCPECVRSFVILMKNEINSEEAKYEHADNYTGKTRESSWLLQGRAPKRRGSGLDCSKRNPRVTAEVSGVSCRLSDDGNRNQYFCCGGRESASVPRSRVR